MFDEGVIIGRVLGIEPATEAKWPDLLILEDRSRGEYPNIVACEFYGSRKELLAKIKNRELVRVVGSIRSSKSETGRWFTHFSGFSLTSMEEALKAVMSPDEAPTPPPVRRRPQHREVGADDSDLF